MNPGSIIGAIAEMDPIDYDGQEGLCPSCFFCGASAARKPKSTMPSAFGRLYVPEHEGDCTWQAAVDFYAVLQEQGEVLSIALPPDTWKVVVGSLRIADGHTTIPYFNQIHNEVIELLEGELDPSYRLTPLGHLVGEIIKDGYSHEEASLIANYLVKQAEVELEAPAPEPVPDAWAAQWFSFDNGNGERDYIHRRTGERWSHFPTMAEFEGATRQNLPPHARPHRFFDDGQQCAICGQTPKYYLHELAG